MIPSDGILLLDKPAGITSNDAVQAIKRLYGATKAGHAGSLDPLATGMLPICLGEATKLCAYLLDSDKRYSTRAAVGARTTTGDAEGPAVETTDAGRLTREILESVLPRFTGELQQRAPMYSARKHQGRRLYELAREGREVPREPHRIRIHSLTMTAFGPGTFSLDVRCSKGTYIRTLVEDLAAAAGQAAHVALLRREEVAPFGAGPMYALEDLRARSVAEREAVLIRPLAALAGWPVVRVDAAQARRLSMGQAVRVEGVPGNAAVVGEGGTLLGIAEIRDGVLAPRRWLAVRGERGAAAGT